MTTSDTSSQMLQDQIRSLSELTLPTIEQLEYVIRNVQNRVFLYEKL
jgi:hypothetical protein